MDQKLNIMDPTIHNPTKNSISKMYGGFKHTAGKQTYKKKTYYTGKVHDKTLSKTQAPADYAKTLINPWLDLNCRIPDLSSFPTATFKYELNYIWNVQCKSDATDNTVMVIDLAETLGLFHCQGLQGLTKENTPMVLSLLLQ